MGLTILWASVSLAHDSLPMIRRLILHKVIESKSVFKGHVFEAKVENIILPSGEEARREVVVHRGGASVLAIYQDNIVLVRQYRHAANNYVLEIPAGIIEVGETPQECATRELREETGYTSTNIRKLLTMYKSVGYTTEKHHIYLAQNLTPGPQELDFGEEVDVVLMPIEKVIKKIFAEEIEDAKTVAGMLAYRELMHRQA